MQRAWLDASRLMAEPSNTILPSVAETGAESADVTSVEGVPTAGHKRKAAEPEEPDVPSKRVRIGV